MNESEAIEPASFCVRKINLIYAFSLPGSEAHGGAMKVGDTSLPIDVSLSSWMDAYEQESHDGPLHRAVRAKVRERIDEQVSTIGVKYEIELALPAVRRVTEEGGKERFETFRDHAIHAELIRREFKRVRPHKAAKSREWFRPTHFDPSAQGVKREAVLDVISQYVNGNVNNNHKADTKREITLRPEQVAAIKHANSRFDRALENDLKSESKWSPDDGPISRVLWNAVMRFGKTLTTYNLIKSREEIKRVLVVCHRTAVGDSWSKDHSVVFDDSKECFYSDAKGEFNYSWENVKDKNQVTHFISMQNLRGSFEKADGDELRFTKNEGIFDTKWDLVVFDEVHEGTETDLAELVKRNLSYKFELNLSGTPYRIIESFDREDVFSFDYVDLCKAKAKWNQENRNSGEVSPYESWPELELRVYDISDSFKGFANGSILFNFNEFFRTKRDKATGQPKFVNERAVYQFLKKLSGEQNGKLVAGKDFPFEDEASRDMFAHTVWLLPSVSAANAMAELIKRSPLFGEYGIVNVAGQENSDEPLRRVRSAIDSAKQNNGRTITLTVGRLTTGVTVPEWTGIMMLNGTTSAQQYFQSAFRVMSAGNLPDGSTKSRGYVFDFAPVRTLTVINDMAKARVASRKRTAPKKGGSGEAVSEDDGLIGQAQEIEASVKEIADYITVMVVDNSKMERVDFRKVSGAVRRAAIRDVVNNGFESPRLYNLTMLDLQGFAKHASRFDNLASVVGKSARSKRDKKITTHSSGFVAEQERRVNAEEDAEVACSLEKEAKSTLDRMKRDAASASGSVSAEDMKRAEEELKEANSLRDEAEKAAAKAREEERNLRNKARDAAMATINAVTTRVPLLVFASDLKLGMSVTVDNFPDLVSDDSWEKYMPKGFLKSGKSGNAENVEDESFSLSWDFVKQFLDRDVFAGACDHLRQGIEALNKMPYNECVYEKVRILSSFRNPNKETVLTLWSTVNRQMAETFGGLRWVDNDGKWYVERFDLESGEWLKEARTYSFEELDDDADLRVAPIWVSKEHDKYWEVGEGENRNTFLDFNSKTAYYPLYVECSLRYKLCETIGLDPNAKMSDDDELGVRELLAGRVFVNCAEESSKGIALRMLSVPFHATVIDFLGIWNALSGKQVSTERQSDGTMKTVKMSKKKVSQDNALRVMAAIFSPAAMSTQVGDGVTASERMADAIVRAKDKSALDKVVTQCLAEHGNNQKFTGLFSNPPYQVESKEGNNICMSAVYHLFAMAGFRSARFVSMIYPSRWVLGGTGDGLKEFRRNNLSSLNYVSYHDFQSSLEFFRGVEIAGGVNYFLVDSEKDQSGVKRYFNGTFVGEHDTLGSNGEFVRDIMMDFGAKANHSMASMVKSRGYYGNSVMNTEKIMALATNNPDDVLIHHVMNREVITSRVPSSCLNPNSDTAGFKVFASKTANPSPGYPFGRSDRIFLGGEGEACSTTFLQIGSFATREESVNCLRYLKTTFSRTLLANCAASHNVTKDTYRLIPLVDFATGEIVDKPGTFLDFSKPDTLDEQLSLIYNISAEKIAYAEKMVRPFKDKVDIEADH